MTDSMSYSSNANAYMAQNGYYSSPQMHHGPHTHQVAPPPRQEPTTRKRPKYTRSKTGCLTCRVKKIKCDEAKPSCMRCAHGQRDCTWPEGVPTRKRASSVKESPDSGSNGPSTASSTASPGISEASSPTSTRGHSPPQRSPVELSLPRDLNLPPLLSNRRQESGYHLPPMHHPSDMESSRRDYDRRRYSPPAAMPMVPDVQQYSRYEPYQSNGHVQIPARHTLASSVRSTMGHHHHPSMQQWSPPPPLMTPPEQYYQPERTLVSNDHMRYT
ncbi:hypothetical protein C8F01DRAFT_228606 [Mycena amicta]|nr:hypothetical protein C8F01DRAFT_228606 [Mycena amicta]